MRSRPWEGVISRATPKDVLNIGELASNLDIPKSTMCMLVREGKLPAQKVGRHWRFRKETIDAWLGNRDEWVESGENFDNKKVG